MPGRTSFPSASAQPGARTVSPQGSGAVFSGVPPTWQFSPIRQFSPRMAYSTTAPAPWGLTVLAPGGAVESGKRVAPGIMLNRNGEEVSK